MPRRAGLSFFSLLGGAAFRLYRRDRQRALGNLALAFPGSDPLVVSAMAKGSFVAVARNAYDAFRLAYISREQVQELCDLDGGEHLAEACRGGNGVVALTGHIGCWELLAAYFAGKGYKVNVVYRELRDGRLEERLIGMRRRHGISSIPRGASAVSAFKALRRGEILAMLIDQDIDVDGVFVPFFGMPAHTPRGAAAFALRAGAPVVPLAIHMQPGGRHRITVKPPLEPPRAGLSEREAVDDLTARCSAAVEGFVRMYPQQWVWFHDRWRRSGSHEAAGAGNRREGGDNDR
jgi:KDO2-lipid IV(A) lauroyltransferase